MGTTPISLASRSGVGNPLVAFKRDSVLQARLMAWGGMCLAGFGGVAHIAAGGGTPMSRIALSLTLSGLVVVFAIALWMLRGVQDTSPVVIGLMGQAVCMSSIGVVWFWGIYSPAMMIFVLALYVYANAATSGLALTGYLTLAAIHGGMWGLIMTGTIPDVGVVNGDRVPPTDKVMSFLIPQLVLLVTFLWARFGRRSTLKVMRELDAVTRSVAVLEALANEARLERERTCGGPGLLSGQIIGSFRLEAVIGRGGMGEVYAAAHIDTGEPAAVKLLRRHMLGDDDNVARFLREVRIMATLDAINIARVLEYPDVEAPLPYVAMELLNGRDLSTILRQQRRLGRSEVIDLVVQICRGLGAAHAVGIVHRDLKPGNLFLAESADGTQGWRILDFGVSKLVVGRGTITRGGLVGTPGYTAPEQIEQAEVDGRADLFSLGVIVYRCITGLRAFVGDDGDMMKIVLTNNPLRPSSVIDVPAEVDAALAIGLAKDPAARYTDANEMSAAIVSALDGEMSDELRARARVASARWPWAEHRWAIGGEATVSGRTTRTRSVSGSS